MVIPESVLKSVPVKASDNVYIYSASDMWKRLEAIEAGTVPFQNFDMALLVNCVELYYKGLLKSSGLKVSDHLIKNSHSLYSLHTEIETRIMSLSGTLTVSERRDLGNFLKDLSEMYISTRYENEQVSFDEFKQCLSWARKQRALVMDTLDPSKEWMIEYKKEENFLPKPGIYVEKDAKEYE